MYVHHVCMYRIHGVSIGIPVDSCYKLVDDHVKELGLVDVNAHDIVDLVDGYIGLGYGKSSQQEMGKLLRMITDKNGAVVINLDLL